MPRTFCLNNIQEALEVTSLIFTFLEAHSLHSRSVSSNHLAYTSHVIYTEMTSLYQVCISHFFIPVKGSAN